MIKNCKYCQKEFDAKRKRYTFCSLKCAAMDRASNPETIQKMSESAKRRGNQPPLIKICQCCGNEFTPKDSRGKFCSTKCIHEERDYSYLKGRVSPNKGKPCSEGTKQKLREKVAERYSLQGKTISLPSRKCSDCGKDIQRQNKTGRCVKCNGVSRRVEKKSSVKCSYCGTDFLKPKKEIKRTQYHFCSKSCMVTFRADAQRGEKNPRYKGNRTLHEALRKLKIYRDWRTAVYERDKYTCRICNTKKSPFEAHHLITVSEIIDIYKLKTIHDAHKCEILKDINNGITVCQPCHKNIHRAKGRKNEIKNNIVVPNNNEFLYSPTACSQDRQN